MFQTYQPSGKMGALTLPLILVGIGLAIALALAYQFLLEWIPLIYVSFLLTWGMGIALGMVGVWVVNTGAMRNVVVAAIMGLLIVLAGVSAKFCFQYSGWLNASTLFVMDQEKFSEDQYDEVRQNIAAEIGFMEYINIRVNEGFTIGGGGGGMPLKGVFVYAIWLIEFGVIAWFGIRMPASAASLPYSEKLAAWASEEEAVMTLPVTDPEMVARIKSAESVDDLLQIPIPKTDVSKQFAVYRVNSIPGQEMEDAYLSVDLVSYTTNSKGETETTTDPLVKHAILSSENRYQLVENTSLLQEAMAAYRESIEAEQQASDESEGTENGESAIS